MVGEPGGDYSFSRPQWEEALDYIAAHPEIPRNVEYYFEGYGRYASRQPLDPEYEALGGGKTLGQPLRLF